MLRLHRLNLTESESDRRRGPWSRSTGDSDREAATDQLEQKGKENKKTKPTVAQSLHSVNKQQH